MIYDNILILNDIYQSGIAAVLGQGWAKLGWFFKACPWSKLF